MPEDAGRLVSKPVEAWSYTVGMLPHKVRAVELLARKGVVYLKWRVNKEWTVRSLGFRVRDAKGKLDREKCREAQLAAEQQYTRNLTGAPVASATKRELTIADGWALAIDPDSGRWPDDTMHRREVARAIQRAKSTWGANALWNDIGRADLRTLWRKELKRARALGHEGVRSTEVVVSRVLTVASWLREEQLIAPTACTPWKAMKEEMASDFARATNGRHAVQRPRYTLEQYRAMLAAAPKVDPRWGLLLTIGAEYRLGQVKRAFRSDVDVVSDPATVRIRGRGKKGGVIIECTPGQRAALLESFGPGGYLHGLERAYTKKQIADYPLFPGVRLPEQDGKPITRREHATRPPIENTQLRKWLRATEERARVDGKPIAHVEGLGWYGLRRVAVDAAKAEKISREGLQQTGGWADSQVPDAIYADQEMTYARREAAEVRARIRGEVTATPHGDDPPSPTVEPHGDDVTPSVRQNGNRTQNGPAEAEPCTDPQTVEES